MIRLKQFQHELHVALEAVQIASNAAKLIEGAPETQIKEDHSPVTVADFTCQMLISYHIHQHFPKDIVIGEEETSFLNEKPVVRERVLELIRRVAPSDVKLTDTEWLSFLDSTTSPPSTSHDQGEAYERYWTIDPIDGTKGFLRKDQYAVCVALLVKNQVELGVLGCPNLRFPHSKCDEKSDGSLLFAVKGAGAYQLPLQTSMDQNPSPIAVSLKEPPHVLLESFESSHSNLSLSKPLLVDGFATSLRMDSQCKYAMLARGEGHIFLRILPDPRKYVEKIWDHAAGSLIVTEAGGIVTDIRGNPLTFHPHQHLHRNLGILATCGPITFHQSIIEKLNSTIEFKNYLRQNAQN